MRPLGRAYYSFRDLRHQGLLSFFFFFQAEDGIRDSSVTGVQTCALPICEEGRNVADAVTEGALTRPQPGQGSLSHGVSYVSTLFTQCTEVGDHHQAVEIGRASCRERV